MVVSRAWEGRERKDGERVVNFQGTFVVPVSPGPQQGRGQHSARARAR
jgi:hypothetical protein